MKEKVLFIAIFIGLAVTELLPRALAQDPKAKAIEILTRARAAIGGPKLESLSSLSVAAGYRRMMSGREMSGEVQIDLLLPDKIMRTETMSPIPSVEITRLEALTGDTSWTDQQTSGTGGAMVMIKRPGDNAPHGEQIRLNALRADFARMTIGWLLKTPANIPVEYSHAGVAESPDGNADVINVTSPHGLNTKLFIDQKSGRLLMMTYQSRKPRLIANTFSGPQRSREEIEKSIRDAEAEAAKQPEVEYQIHLDDYREVNGISFSASPLTQHRGEINEEWEVKEFKVNAKIKPEKFVKK
ncbi:MAG: hypothetical protein IPM55_18055 [Acidobacteria bacterium]|nr:hypothetical protein [Acidobacteriota bacterium]